MTGTACAASFCVTTTPKRDAICAINRTRPARLPQPPAFGDEARGLRHRFSEQPAHSKIPALGRIRLAIPRPQSEHLQGGEGALRVREVLALAACDVPEAYVFISERGGGPIGFHRLIQRVGEAAKMPFSIHPHMLRHACGFKLANDGHDTRGLAAPPSGTKTFNTRSGCADSEYGRRM